MRIQPIRDWLLEPAVRNHDVDSLDFSMAHREVLQRKVILQKLVKSIYEECLALDLHYFEGCPGRRLEIGSGSSMFKTICPDVITSDIKALPFVDIVLGAEKIPFRAHSMRTIIADNAFHHFEDPRAFFKEALRVLHPGGGVILIEPFYGPFARFIFRRLHNMEDFDPDEAGWQASRPKGPFSNANQALSYIVFRRDRSMFEREFPDLTISFDRPHTHIWLLLSGGLNFRQLLPDSLTPLAKLVERALAPFNQWLALQHTIVLRKRLS